MTPERSHQSILANLSSHSPVDLDAIIFDAPRAGDVSDPDVALFPPSSAIWDMPEDGPSRIGVRIREPIQNADFIAARLASIAVERRIHPIFLSYIRRSGIERFGFRVEQFFGLTEQSQANFETQLSRLWRFALIIDASDIERLG